MILDIDINGIDIEVAIEYGEAGTMTDPPTLSEVTVTNMEYGDADEFMCWLMDEDLPGRIAFWPEIAPVTGTVLGAPLIRALEDHWADDISEAALLKSPGPGFDD